MTGLSTVKSIISGAGDPRCKIMIVMVKTSQEAEPYRQQSQILVPMDTPGVEVLGPMMVYGDPHAPHGHMHIKFTVRVPKENVCLARAAVLKFRFVWARQDPPLHALNWTGRGSAELMVNAVQRA